MAKRSKKPDLIRGSLEGTLISNAMSQIPRPGLFELLMQIQEICNEVVIFTAVNETRYREIAKILVRDNLVPKWFEDIRYIKWHSETKDLRFIDNDIRDILLIDDYEIYIHPGQEDNWLQTEEFAYPYRDSDKALANIFYHLNSRSKCNYLKLVDVFKI